MAKLKHLTARSAVLQALAEFAELGRDAFLKKYGFGPSRRFFLVHEGKHYDSKAVVGAAFGYQHGSPLAAADFSGGDRTVRTQLESLGFEMLVLPPVVKDASARNNSKTPE